MRKGLTNLVAVAVALLGVNAMAMAPTIGDIPSPIIGDFNGATGNNHFVFEDAFNLLTLVSDDATTAGGIVWSYETAGGQYSINNVAENTGSPIISSGSAFSLTTNGLDPDDIDMDPYTVTLRDITYSPVGGPDSEPGANNAAGYVNTDVVTFWASDPSTATSKSVIFYTQNEGEDAFSGGFGAPIVDLDFTSGALGWTYRTSTFAIPPASDPSDMTGAQGAQGLCVTTILSDLSFGGWVSNPADAVDLVDNSVYQLRLVMSSNAAVGATPIMQYVINNTAGLDSNGFAYGGEFFIVDAEGGANSIVSRSAGTYNWYFVPTQVQVSNWQSTTGGAFDPANSAIKNFRMEFNVFDVNGVGAAENRAGTICLSNLTVSRAALSALNTGAAVYNVASGGFNATSWGGLINSSAAAGFNGQLNASYSAGNLVVTATNSALDLTVIEPGPAAFAVDAAHYPIATVADQLYKVEWTVAASAGTPIEIIRLDTDLTTNEIISNAYGAASAGDGVTALGTAALPTGGGAAEVYTSFFYTHSTSLSGGLIPAWRPKLSIANRTDVNGAAAANNALTFSDVTIAPVN